MHILWYFIISEYCKSIGERYGTKTYIHFGISDKKSTYFCMIPKENYIFGKNEILASKRSNF